MARPPKPQEERSVTHNTRWPPTLWERLKAAVPARKRSEFIRKAVEEKLEKGEKS